MNNEIKALDRFTEFAIIFCAGLVAGVICLNRFYASKQVIPNTDVIDSLTTVNDSIKLKVEHLDSIKNAKVIEVSTLDNDSTLKLFYKLVSE